MKNSFLYTGRTSSLPRLVDRAAKLLHLTREQEGQRIKLKPAAEVLFTLIEAEKTNVMLVKRIDLKSKADELKIDLLARQRYVEYLDGLKARLTIVLREPDEEVAA